MLSPNIVNIDVHWHQYCRTLAVGNKIFSLEQNARPHLKNGFRTARGDDSFAFPRIGPHIITWRIAYIDNIYITNSARQFGWKITNTGHWHNFSIILWIYLLIGKSPGKVRCGVTAWEGVSRSSVKWKSRRCVEKCAPKPPSIAILRWPDGTRARACAVWILQPSGSRPLLSPVSTIKQSTSPHPATSPLVASI